MRRMSGRIKSDGLIAVLAAALSELYIPIKKKTLTYATTFSDTSS